MTVVVSRLEAVADKANKTQPTHQAVSDFLAGVDNEQRRADSQRLIALMSEATGSPATMWGASIIGFGSYHYRYASGREGDAPLVGFSPRKSAITLYAYTEADLRDELLAKL